MMQYMVIQRKIVGFGYSKLVCLPKHWYDIQGYKKGDLITIELADNGDLILRGKETILRHKPP